MTQPAEPPAPARRPRRTPPPTSPLTPPEPRPPAPEAARPETLAPSPSVAAPVPRSTFPGLVDATGDPIAVDDLFTEPVKPSRFVTVKRRVFEQFVLPNTAGTVGKRLVLPRGARVTVEQADQIRRQYGEAAGQ